MSRENVVNQLNSFFADAQASGLQVHDDGRHIRTDLAVNLSLNDISTSHLSSELRKLVALGFRTSEGVMMTKIVRHQPKGGKLGWIVFELAGASSRIGGELVTHYDDRGNSNYLYIGPSHELFVSENFEVSKPFRNRPEDIQEQDALALVALARKAIGLEE